MNFELRGLRPVERVLQEVRIWKVSRTTFGEQKSGSLWTTCAYTTRSGVNITN